MCFGDKLNEEQIKEIKRVQRQLLLSFGQFNILNFKPKLTKIIFKNRWRAKQGSKTDDKDNEFVLSYTDTLLDLELPDGNEKRKLSEGEMVSQCSEFLDAGTDTTSTALQWIMANVVKYPQVQEKLFAEIKRGMGETEDEVREEVLHKLPYLKAVILEGLRRDPPAHFVPRAVTHDVDLGGHVVPKNGSVSFMLAGWDPQVWEDPMAFKPERFLGSSGGEEGFDLRGSREIKMMPFGAGRRICPASGLAVLRLEYFVANLVWKFEWRAVEGDDVDLSEKQEFTIVMKNPLHAHGGGSGTQQILPPGPRVFPVIGGFLFLLKSFSELEPIIRKLKAKHGPIISLRIGSRPAVFIGDRFLAHQALIQNGAVFADRPRASATNKYSSSNQHNISSATYGPTWRLLRRNLTSEILHPSRVKSYGNARKWVLDILVNRLKTKSQSHSEGAGAGVRVVDHFQYAMFCLLVLMCFGDKLNEEQIKQIEGVQRQFLLSSGRVNILNFTPKLTKIIFKNRWRQFFKILEERREVLVPLIRARQNKAKQGSKNDDKDDEFVLSYTDTLLDLELPDGNKKRKLSEGEMVSLCSEFLNGGTDTTSTALQWIMANVVKYPQVQEKLFAEIKGVMGETEEEVREEVLHKLPYLKAVILEGLRRHPPGHFVLPHAVTHDVVLGGHVVPKNGSVNFMVADIGWDPQVWEDPMEFKPERFLSSGGGEERFDLTGSREIKMMPFGAGRRICPASGLAVLHLEYFVANLVWKFEWRAVEGDDVDLSEKQEATVVMKNPLQAHGGSSGTQHIVIKCPLHEDYYKIQDCPFV
ncbi:hypothetical protein DVH24_022537 [Malus domestica]|uniref:Cytochrome P450 n=1 Tax=Malus domestica TaxID=3750 RepID=A0A498KTU4_MALDO|nr:hypothetical protein DVH24_022537 [Malus domestica]